MKNKRLRNRPLEVRRLGVEESMLEDIYHRLLRLDWLRLYFLILVVFACINLIFATLYWLRPGCIGGIPDGSFFHSFAFSVQTLSTIGYGNFYPLTDYAHSIVTVEAATGLLSIALLTGLIFAKFARPSSRVVFSENILWTKVNGQPMLALRLGNIRANRVFEGRAKMALLRDETTLEGEEIRRIIDLKLVRSESPIFSLSWTIYHPMDSSSPFSGVEFETLKETGWEIFVTFIGLDQDMAQNIVAHTTYAMGHIVKAKKFVDMIEVDDHVRIIDFSKLHQIEVE